MKYVITGHMVNRNDLDDCNFDGMNVVDFFENGIEIFKKTYNSYEDAVGAATAAYLGDDDYGYGVDIDAETVNVD